MTNLRRYTKPEVDAAIEQVEHGVLMSHAIFVLAGEVVALRTQYRSVQRCPVHNCRMHVSVGIDQVVCWRCTEANRLEAKIVDLTTQLRAATECPSGSLGPEDGRVTCRYRSLKQQQVHALQVECDRLRNENAQLKVEYHFLLQGTEPAVGT